MEPEGLLLCSQDPAIGPDPEPDESSPYHPSHHILVRSILILFSHLHLGLPSSLFLSGIPINILYAFLFPPVRVKRPAHFVLIEMTTLIIFGDQYNFRFMQFSPAFY
jgi:hypothetical protein